MPAERFPFLKPWSETQVSSRRVQQSGVGSYAPPRPVAPPPPPPVHEEQSVLQPFLGGGVDDARGSDGAARLGDTDGVALGATSFSERVELNRNLNGNMDSGDIANIHLSSGMGDGLAATAAVDDEGDEAELLQVLGDGGGGGGKVFDEGDLGESV